jgi:hypothetical protein
MLLQQLINLLHLLHKTKTTDSVKVSYGCNDSLYVEICRFRRIFVGVMAKIWEAYLLQCKCHCLIVQTLHPKCRWQQLQVSHCWPLPLFLPSLHCHIHIKGTCHIRHNTNMWVLFTSNMQSDQCQRCVP